MILSTRIAILIFTKTRCRLIHSMSVSPTSLQRRKVEKILFVVTPPVVRDVFIVAKIENGNKIAKLLLVTKQLYRPLYHELTLLKM